MSIASKWWPIWKYVAEDIHATSGYAADTIRFRVRACDTETDVADPDGGTPIYEGIGSAAPNSVEIWVSINDIVADYLSAPFNIDGSRWVAQPQLGGWFALDAYDTANSVWENMTFYFFVMDYSYDRDFDLAAMPLAHPVTGIVAPNQWLVVSFVDVEGQEEVEWILTFNDGTQSNISQPLARYADFNNDFNNDFAVDEGEAAVAGYAGLYLGNHPDLASVVCECGDLSSPVYSVRQDTCKRYALYYRNAYGGYDSLLLDGAKRAENYTRATIGRWADNSVAGQREVFDYRNDIEEAWTMRIGGLTDAQAERMPQVIGSTDAYLCDLNTDTLIPLNLTDAACEVKTYRNQGGKRIDYQITAKRAQKRERR